MADEHAEEQRRQKERAAHAATMNDLMRRSRSAPSQVLSTTPTESPTMAASNELRRAYWAANRHRTFTRDLVTGEVSFPGDRHLRPGES